MKEHDCVGNIIWEEEFRTDVLCREEGRNTVVIQEGKCHICGRDVERTFTGARIEDDETGEIMYEYI